jgi:hypothetical protein
MLPKPRVRLLASLAFVVALCFAASEAHASGTAGNLAPPNLRVEPAAPQSQPSIHAADDESRRLQRTAFAPGQPIPVDGTGIVSTKASEFTTQAHPHAPARISRARAPPASR